MGKSCSLKDVLKSVQISNIVYDNDDGVNGFFTPGNSPDRKMLRVIITSEEPFVNGTMMTLELIGTKDQDYFMTKIDPIKAYRDIDEPTNTVVFDVISEDIPIPMCVGYVPNHVDDCTHSVPMYIGNALEYCFILHIECCKHRFKIGIPLNARYIGASVRIDVKCERLDLISEPDDTHTIKVICNENDVYYTRKPHCVTHCQAPRPVSFYYTI